MSLISSRIDADGLRKREKTKENPVDCSEEKIIRYVLSQARCLVLSEWRWRIAIKQVPSSSYENFQKRSTVTDH
jgi:hypothetical protein